MKICIRIVLIITISSILVACSGINKEKQEPLVKVIPDETRQQLKRIIPPVGGMTRNPIDMAQAVAANIDVLNKTLELVFNEPGIDLVMIDEPPITGFLPIEGIHAINDIFINFRKNQKKPLVVVSSPWFTETERLPVEQKLLDAEIPVFPTFERAAKAIDNMKKYSKLRSAKACG